MASRPPVPPRERRPDAPPKSKAKVGLCYIAAVVCFLASVPLAGFTDSGSAFLSAIKWAILFLIAGGLLGELIGLRRDIRGLHRKFGERDRMVDADSPHHRNQGSRE